MGPSPPFGRTDLWKWRVAEHISCITEALNLVPKKLDLPWSPCLITVHITSREWMFLWMERKSYGFKIACNKLQHNSLPVCFNKVAAMESCYTFICLCVIKRLFDAQCPIFRGQCYVTQTHQYNTQENNTKHNYTIPGLMFPARRCEVPILPIKTSNLSIYL